MQKILAKRKSVGGIMMIMMYNDNFTDSSGVNKIGHMEPYCHCGLMMFRFLCCASHI